MKKTKAKNQIKEIIPDNCRDFQNLNRSFVEGKLPFKTALAFARHVRTCPDCMEELRAYFMFYFAARYLNENEAVDMPTNVEALLKKVENEAVYQKKRLRNLILAVAAFATGASILVTLFLNGAFS